MAKNLPVIGEAFLGSDPLAQKVIRISFGVDTTEGVNDVILTADTALKTLLTVSDTKFVITDMALRVVAAFSSISDVTIGTNSSPSHFMSATVGANAMRTGHTLVTANQWIPLRWHDSAVIHAGLNNPAWSYTNDTYPAKLPFPQDSSDTIIFGDVGVLPAQGDAELYIFYIEVP